MNGIMQLINAWLLILISRQAIAHRILFIDPIGTKSHHNSYVPLCFELVNREHDVTFLSFARSGIKHENFTERIIEGANEISKKFVSNMFDNKEESFHIFKVLWKNVNLMSEVALMMHENEKLKQIIHQDYDLVVFSLIFSELMLPIATERGIPFIVISPNALFGGYSKYFGVQIHPSYVPSLMTKYVPPLKFLERVFNSVIELSLVLIMKALFSYSSEPIVRQYFPTVNSLDELFYMNSGVLINTHLNTAYSVPLPENVVEIGGIHCRPSKPLPKDLEDFIDEGKDGFILLSLGSAIPMKYVPEKKRQALFNVFSKLSQQVFIKWDGEAPSTVPSNVKLLKWAPQQDLLGHSNIRLFVTHGGLYSLQEAIFHSTPVIGIPVGNDQGQNLARAEKEGYAKVLTWEELDENTLGSAINEVLYNESYKINAERLSNIFRDQPETPLQRAVYWIEYIIRHKGAHHLKHPGLHLPWYQTSLFDVLLFLGAIVLIIVYINFVIARRILQKITRGTKTPVTKNKKKQ
ncbi:UDP-glycosyltransferase UGT5-like isoform X1 [Artemia franciscana]|uniref:UDP-glycosyltransferase UGT5-like isoform X1 n=1 Tax=Artemia franciscana TaxID=6661 RepID=UPI0032DA43D9